MDFFVKGDLRPAVEWTGDEDGDDDDDSKGLRVTLSLMEVESSSSSSKPETMVGILEGDESTVCHREKGSAEVTVLETVDVDGAVVEMGDDED